MDVSNIELFGNILNIKDNAARSGIDNLQQQIDDTQHRIDNIAIPQNIGDHVRWYIDGELGNDENDGTAGSPWKTLDKFFSMANSVTTDIRCYIVKAGTYNFSKPVVQGVTLHISATVPGVTINGNLSEPWAFYNSHINFQGTSSGDLTVSCNDKIYGDNCMMMLKYVNFTNELNLNGGLFFSKYCKFTRLELLGAFAELYAAQYTSTDATTNNLRAESGAVVITSGVSYFAGKVGVSNESDCFISNESAIMIIKNSCNRQGNNSAKYGIKNSNGIIVIDSARLDTYAAESVSGNFDSNSFFMMPNNCIQFKNALRYNNGAIQYYDGHSWVNTQ